MTPLPEIPEAFSDIWLPAPFKAYYGGRGKGASWSMVRALVHKAHTQKLFIVCGREVQKTIQESVHRLFANQIKLLGLSEYFVVGKTFIRGIASGSEIAFVGLSTLSIDGLRSLEGCDILYISEAANISKYSWETIVPTIRKDGSEIWVDWNPNNETDPTHVKFTVNPPTGAIVRKVHYYENPYFPKKLEQQRQDALKLIEDARDDAERTQAQLDYDHVWGGEPRKISMAAVFRSRVEFREFETPKDAHFHHGLDFGFSQDPLAFIRSYVDEATNTLYIDREVFGIGIEIDDTPAALDKIETARAWPIKADCSNPALISYLRRQGFNIAGAEKWPNSVEDGVAHLKGFKRIVIHEKNCPNMCKEAKLYSFKVDAKTKDILPIIVDKHNHGWDATRYALDKYILRRGGLSMWEKLAK